MPSTCARHHRVALLLALAVPLVVIPVGRAQPTYPLDVKAHLQPLATLTLKGARISRSAVRDDPGFRLQYHFRKEGKTVAVVEARSRAALDIPLKTSGIYTLVLELFYPAYKGGDKQKGEFKPVSNVVNFRVEPGAKPTDPVKVIYIESPKPAAGKPAVREQGTAKPTKGK